MASNDSELDEQAVAEDYRRQRQAAAARKRGKEPVGQEEYVRWLQDNKEKLVAAANLNGRTGPEVEAGIEDYIKTLSELPGLSEFDDPGTTIILRNLLQRVEQASKKLQMQTRGGAVIGDPGMSGLLASQLPVLLTDASIIEITSEFIVFCNFVSKAFAFSLAYQKQEPDVVGITFDPKQINERLDSEPWITMEWGRLLIAYAVNGGPPTNLGPVQEGPQADIRRVFLEGMQVFAVAHEFGHHSLMHGISESSAQFGPCFEQEHEADSFARLISEALAERPEDHVLLSAAGGALVLGALELVTRTRAVLVTGSDVLAPSSTHPPVAERVRSMDEADLRRLPDSLAKFWAENRRQILVTLGLVWDRVKPFIEHFHAEGLRPAEVVRGPVDWLPLGPHR
jgi:hypothetical protein